MHFEAVLPLRMATEAAMLCAEAAMMSLEARAFSKNKNHTKMMHNCDRKWDPRFCLILNEFLCFEAVLISEDGHRGCHVVCRGCLFVCVSRGHARKWDLTPLTGI